MRKQRWSSTTTGPASSNSRATERRFSTGGSQQGRRPWYGFTIQTNPYTGTAQTDFLTTVTLTEILVKDAGGNPIRGVTVSSTSGTTYPLSPLNAGDAGVPEPATVLLAGAGLALLMAVRRR